MSVGLTPKRRMIALEKRLRAKTIGPEITRKRLSGRATRRAIRSGLRDRQHLRHLLADADVDRGDQGEGDRDREADRDPGGEAAEDRLQQLRQRGLAEEADPDRGDRDPDLAGGERLVDLVELLDDRIGAALALLGKLLDFAAATADQRELGRDEEAVDGDQQQQQCEQEDAHRLCARVLRGRSSSAMRQTKYSFPPCRHRDKCHIERPMRIASLVPSATEMLFALGLGDSVVAVTHECDYPREVRSLPT